MTDSYRDLHGDAYTDWKQHAADDYAAAQRRAFLDGFESAANEGKEFWLLREWVEEQRDRAKAQSEGSDMQFARHLAFKDVLVKLHEMGCEQRLVDEGKLNLL